MGKNNALDKMKELKITYNGIINDITNITHLCSVCLLKNVLFYKPKAKVVINLNYLLFDIYKNSKLNMH